MDYRNDTGEDYDDVESDDGYDAPRVTEAERREAVGIAFVTISAWDDEPTDDEYSDDGPDGIIYSTTVPCGMCGEIHPC